MVEKALLMHKEIANLVEDTRFFAYKSDNVIPAANSCAVCGAHGEGGGMHYVDSVGFHSWVEPSDELRLKRMKARINTPNFEYHWYR